MNNPRVSVIIPVYNTEKWVGHCIESLLEQTYDDFEAIFIDDCSTDRSCEVIASYHDERIRLYRNEQNLGAAATRNKAIDLARGEFIAQLDSDDYSTPDRLEKQVAFLDTHPEIDICSTWYRMVDGEGRLLRTFENPTGPDDLKVHTLFGSVLHNSGVMMRREKFLATGERYRPGMAEDFDLWNRLAFHMRFANIPEYLLYWVRREDQTSTRLKHLQDESARQVFAETFDRLGIPYTEEELDLHLHMYLVQNFHFTRSQLKQYSRFLRTIFRAGCASGELDPFFLKKKIVRDYKRFHLMLYPHLLVSIQKRVFKFRLTH